ncbi:PsaF/MyfF family fimbrial adhesin regulatory protein [Escherichia coli]|uniref:PsaF/MyfF family fimbrial adhesin regulatory protein n=1 Tax=Escherichia coli TaxID=562 RepID=UPI00147F4D6D|nr:PsaF/MyfF family fimbrial adhesin regulatory protein [Escherichia coli]
MINILVSINKMRNFFILSVSLFVTVIGFLFYWCAKGRTEFCAEKEFNGIKEHIDIKINYLHYSMLHYVTKGNLLILSENYTGISLRKNKNDFLLIPLEHHNIKYNDVLSLDELGKFFSVCIYQQNNVKHNTILFLQNVRGIADINGDIIRLPSLFLNTEQRPHPQFTWHR